MTAENLEQPQAPAASGASTSFFASRWRGEVPLARLFWQDMWIYGTGINVAAALLALLLFARDVPTPVAAVAYFLPLPYNFFLFAAVWKNAAAVREPWESAARFGALLWVVLATLI